MQQLEHNYSLVAQDMASKQQQWWHSKH